MRVTYVAVGGLGRRYANSNYAQRLLKAPTEVEVVAVVRRGTEVGLPLPDNVTVIPARWSGLVGFYAYALVLLLSSVGRSSDVVVTDRSATSIVGWLARRPSGYRWVADLWDLPHKELVTYHAEASGRLASLRQAVSRLKVASIGPVLRRADQVIASLIPAGLARYRIPPERLASFCNAIDLKALEPGSSDAGAPGPRRDPHTLCFVSSIFLADRGLGVVLEALEILHERGTTGDLKLEVMGNIPALAIERIEASPASDWVELHAEGGLIEAHELMRRSEIGLLPFLSNEDLDHTYPIKLFEYMALGCVVVASDLPGIRAVVGSESTAVLVEPGDPAALAEALEETLGDADRRQALREAASVRVMQFDSNVKVARIYEAIAPPGKRGGGHAR